MAGSTQKFDAASVPLVNDFVRSNQLADYEHAPEAKALAISWDGWGIAFGKDDPETAKREALERCRAANPTALCNIYAVGNAVVWPPSMLRLPMAVDIRRDAADAPLTADDIHRILTYASRETIQRAIDRYAAMSNPKVFAIGKASYQSSSHATQAEAIRVAIERCSYRDQAPCLLLSVDGQLNVRVPQSRPLNGPFTIAGEREMTEADQKRVAQIYGGKEWRALARGKRGGWFPVADAPSESAAVDAALAACAQSEHECRLYALGNFRVKDDQSAAARAAGGP